MPAARARTNLVVVALTASVAIWLLVVVPAAGQRPESTRDTPVWLDPDRESPAGTRYHTFNSSTVNKKASCLVWLPPEYSRTSNTKFPVIYWLHGIGGNQRTFSEKYLPAYFEALKQKAAPTAIVVGVNGIPGSLYADAANGKCLVESVIIKDLIPNIDKSYRTIATREGRMIEGFSMGGMGAARLGFKYPDMFGAIVINSAGPLGMQGKVAPISREVFGTVELARAEMPVAWARKNAETLKKETLIRLACGTDDDLIDDNRQLDAALNKLGIPHAFIELPGVGHNPAKLYDALGQRAFRLHLRAFSGI